MMKHGLTTLGLSILGIQDYQKGEISFIPLVFLIDFQYLYGYLILAILLLTYRFYSHLIGGADLIVTSLLLTRFDFVFVNHIILWASLCALCTMVIKKQQKLFFIPYILCGYLISVVTL